MSFFFHGFSGFVAGGYGIKLRGGTPRRAELEIGGLVN